METMKSPLPAKVKEAEIVHKVEVMMDFFQALRGLSEGKKISRKEWDDKKDYGCIIDGIVCIHRDDKDYSWLIAESDMKAVDWIFV